MVHFEAFGPVRHAVFLSHEKYYIYNAIFVSATVPNALINP